MSLKVIDSKMLDHTRTMLVVEAKELQSLIGDNAVHARSWVIKEAQARGVRIDGLSSESGPYPIDEDGQCSDLIQTGHKAVVAYRKDYLFHTGGLGVM